MSGQAPYGYQLEPTVVEGIRTKKMVADPVAADHVRLMFEMYAEPETSFGDITRYFEEHDIKIYGKSMFRTFLSQLLRNPVYAQADLELYEFFKSQGAAIVNDASDFAGTNGCYLYQGRDVKEDKDRCLKDQILVIAPHEALISSDTWLKCRKKLMANTTFQQGRKPKNTWLAGKIKCGHCGYALKATHVPNSTGYFRCTKRTENKGCPGCGKIRKEEFEQFIFSAMQEKFKDFQILHGREEKVNPKLTAYQVELAQVEAEIEKLLDTLTGANATLLAYANKKIEELDTRRQTISKAIAELSVETISPQQIKKLSYYLDNWESIDFDDKRKAADSTIKVVCPASFEPILYRLFAHIGGVSLLAAPLILIRLISRGFSATVHLQQRHRVSDLRLYPALRASYLAPGAGFNAFGEVEDDLLFGFSQRGGFRFLAPGRISSSGALKRIAISKMT